MNILILSPHRDDAALSLSLAIEQWLEEGHCVEVLNCFTLSEYAPLATQTALRDSDLCAKVSAMRLSEDQAWLGSFGDARRLRITDLSLEDAPIRLKCTAGEVCLARDSEYRDDEWLEAEIVGAIEKSNMQALVSPLALGNHIDHVIARNAILSSDVCRSCPCAFYEDLPYASRGGVDVGIADVAQSLGLSLDEAFVSRGSNIGAAMDRKRQSATFYRSQIESSVAEDIAQFCIRYEGRERIWVNRLWQDSSLMFLDAIRGHRW